MWKILLAIVLLCILHQGLGEKGCPDPRDIPSCRCEDNGDEGTRIFCQDFSDAEDLRKDFINLERYSFEEVYIQQSTLQYLPYNIFESVKISRLYLENVTLTNLFDRQPQALDNLRALGLSYTRVMRGIIWELMEPLKGLRELSVFGNPIGVLGRDFSKYVGKDLERFYLYGTKTKVIKPGTFANFTGLMDLKIQNCELTTLTRDMLPNPFVGFSLSFRDNKISKITDGLFKQMSYLRYLNLSNNNIARFQIEAFDSAQSVSMLLLLDIEGNPIKCDCLLVWLIDVKPDRTFGRCASPKRLEGRWVQDLKRDDFNC